MKVGLFGGFNSMDSNAPPKTGERCNSDLEEMLTQTPEYDRKEAAMTDCCPF